MGSVTTFGSQEQTNGPFKYRTLPEILRDEQVAFAARMRAKNIALLHSDLAAASVEERMGAALLRIMLNHMDIVLEDNHASIVRMVLPNDVMNELLAWGADNEDLECNRDLEQWDFMQERARLA